LCFSGNRLVDDAAGAAGAEGLARLAPAARWPVNLVLEVLNSG
jgi:hypothetical protein